MSRVRSLLALLGLLVWVAAPAAAVWYLSREAQQATLVEPAVTWMPVVINDDPLSTPVDIVLRRASVPTVVAPALAGLVESTSVAPGQVMRSGQQILVADGIARTAVASPRPFTRALGTANGFRRGCAQ